VQALPDILREKVFMAFDVWHNARVTEAFEMPKYFHQPEIEKMRFSNSQRPR
jgi:hypothetical protein